MKRKLSPVAVISGIMLIAAAALAVYIMKNHLGLADGLDFGAGAYYYADIPNFERFTDAGAYHSPVPTWAIILIFLAWGRLMYRLWTKIDA